MQTRKEKLQAARAALRDLKAQLGCAHCGDHDPDRLTLHHLDPATKHRGGRGSAGQLERYAQGTQVLCQTCHTAVHRAEQAARATVADPAPRDTLVPMDRSPCGMAGWRPYAYVALACRLSAQLRAQAVQN